MKYGLKYFVHGRRVHLHRAIAERAVGRVLPRTVQVHHVDEDPTNNAHRNLVICQDNAYHALLHQRTKTLRAGGNPDTERVCCTCDRPREFGDFYSAKHSECKACASRRAGNNHPRKGFNPVHKLRSPEVRKTIYELLAMGLTQRQVAARVGVRQCSISAFIRRERRNDVRA